MTTSILCSIIEWKRIILCELIALVTFNLIPGGVREKENVEEERAAKGPKRKASQRKTTLNGNCHKRPGFLIVDPLSLF